MNQGYIKIYRKFKENSFYKNSEAVHLWLHLLFSASFKNNTFYYKNTKIELKRGQLITGRKKLSQETGINESSIFRLLKLFESEHQIEQQKTNKYSIITIVSYDKYKQDEQQMNNKRTTNEQQMNTTKELKELKELKEEEDEEAPTNLKNWYGEFANVFLNDKQLGKLKSLILNDDFLFFLIDELSSNIAVGRAPRFDETQPWGHYAMVKKYWEYRKNNPDRFKNKEKKQGKTTDQIFEESKKRYLESLREDDIN